MQTFFINNNDLLIIHPSINELNALELNMITSPFNFDLNINGPVISKTCLNDFSSGSFDIYKQKIVLDSQNIRFNQIFCNIYDEQAYFNNKYEQYDINEAFITLSYNDSNVKTLLLERNSKIDVENPFKVKQLYEVNLKNERIIY